MVLKQSLEYDWEELNRIIIFCQNVKARINPIPREEKNMIRETLVNFCRRCKDEKCQPDCEVKTTYAALFS